MIQSVSRLTIHISYKWAAVHWDRPISGANMASGPAGSRSWRPASRPWPSGARPAGTGKCPGALAGRRRGSGKRGPSCGARRGLRGTQSARPCRSLRQKILPASAAGGGRIFCPRLSALGSKPPVSKTKGPAPKCGSFRFSLSINLSREERKIKMTSGFPGMYRES